MSRISLGRYGFSVEVRDDDSHLAAALTVEGLGFGTLWLNGGQLDRLDRLTDLLAATTTAVVGSAIIPPDRYSAAEVSELFARAEADAPARLMVGLGSSHRPRALTLLGDYLDALDAVASARRRRGCAFGNREPALLFPRNAKLDPHRILFADLAADLAGNGPQELPPPFGVASPAILASISGRAQELRDQVAVGSMDLHPVEACLTRSPGGLAKGAHNAKDFHLRHGTWTSEVIRSNT